jgi:hypothetical protein
MMNPSVCASAVDPHAWACPRAITHTFEISKVGDFDGYFEIRTFDRDFGYDPFREQPGRDYQREERDQNSKLVLLAHLQHTSPPN